MMMHHYSHFLSFFSFVPSRYHVIGGQILS